MPKMMTFRTVMIRTVTFAIIAFPVLGLSPGVQAQPVVIGGDGKPSVEINERLVYGVGAGLPPLSDHFWSHPSLTDLTKSGSALLSGLTPEGGPVMPALGLSNRTTWIIDSAAEATEDDHSSKDIEMAELAPEVEPAPETEIAELAPEAEPAPETEIAELAPEAEPVPETEMAELAPEAEPAPETEMAELAPEAEPAPETEMVDALPQTENNTGDFVAPPPQSAVLAEMLSTGSNSGDLNPDSTQETVQTDFIDAIDVETTDDESRFVDAVPPPPDFDMDQTFRVSLLKDENQTIVSEDEVAEIDSTSESMVSDSDNGEPLNLIEERFDQQVAALPPDMPVSGLETSIFDDTVPVFFRSGSASLDDDALGIIADIAERLVKSPEARLKILAFSEHSGNDTNKARRLSLSRAIELRTAFAENGVDETRMDIKALGSSHGDGSPNRADLVIVSP